LSKLKYKKPAIIEAVFELRLPTDNSWGVSSFIKFANAASKKGFSEVVDAAEGFQVNFSNGVDEKPELKQVSRACRRGIKKEQGCGKRVPNYSPQIGVSRIRVGKNFVLSYSTDWKFTPKWLNRKKLFLCRCNILTGLS
jgi:hypothetical protein